MRSGDVGAARFPPSLSRTDRAGLLLPRARDVEPLLRRPGIGKGRGVPRD